MKEILNAVMLRLKEQVPELKWIGLNIGQMDLENPPVDYPCALIDIPTINYSNLGNRTQTGELNVEIELYFQVQSPSNMSMPLELREQAMAHYDIVSKVYIALEGFAGENFGSLNRRKTTRNNKVAPRGFVMDFVCLLSDSSASPQYTAVQVYPVINQ